MAKDGKKARKADKASKPKKLKIPKKGLLATEIAAAAITAIARSPRRRPGN